MVMEWFQNEEKFEILTEVMSKSVQNGTITQSSIDSKLKLNLIEEAVDQGIFCKRAHFYCSRCDKTYPPKSVPTTCICGRDFPTNPSPDVIEYYSKKYPEIVANEIGHQIEDLKITYDSLRLDNVQISDLHPVSLGEKYLHISPLYQADSGIHTFPGYLDAFLSWNRVPQLLTSPQEVYEEVSPFLDRLDDAHKFADEEDSVLYDGGQNRPNFPPGTGWFTLLDGMEKKDANAVSNDFFGINYNSLYELLGIDFLYTMFPRSMVFDAGGNSKPDGYLIQEDRTFLVESKCYSDGFKLFSEEDKSARYIKDFQEKIDNSPERDFNLGGYIFIAYEFKEGSLPEDIESFLRRNRSDVNLDVICINGHMMAEAVEQLRKQYTLIPSARHRVYDWSERYKDILDMMHKNTMRNGACLEVFKTSILSQMIDIGKEEVSEVESIIETGFEGKSKFDTSIPTIS